MGRVTNEQRAKVQQSGTWGLSVADFLSGSQDIQICFFDGKTLSGFLLGIDRFDYFVRQATGQIVMVPKHSVRWLAPLNSGAVPAGGN